MRKIKSFKIFEKMETQQVEVYIMLSGDYCSFSEVSLNVVYDITNDIAFDDYTIEQLQRWRYTDYSDVSKRQAIKVGNEYYVKMT